jgi:2-oxoglutarate ferredoxin oxidoreductase subunit delta
MARDKKPVVITIYDDLCKGCIICVDVCPHDTLEMRGLYAAVRKLDTCTKCMICELRCPDFAITVD